MTDSFSDDATRATAPADRAGTPAGDGGEDDRISVSRAVAWIIVGIVALLGVALYFLYARRVAPLAG